MKKITIIAGHYGSGKTNIAVELALELRKRHEKVALADLDIVNPYFRAADSQKLLAENGITGIIPVYANTNVDIPTLPEKFRTVFDTEVYSVLDVGGDDDGAIVLAGYKEEIEKAGYEMLCVVNMYRPMIATAEQAAEYLYAMQNSSRLTFTGIVNNSNLGAETTAEDIIASLEYADKVAGLTNLQVLYTTALKTVPESDRLKKIKNIKFINNTTKQLF